MISSAKEYSNQESWLFWPIINVIVFYLGTGLLCLLLVGLLASIIYARFSGSSTPFLYGEELFFTILGLPLVISLPSISINQNTKLQVLEGGINVRVFHFYFTWKFIRWEEVLELVSLPASIFWNQPAWLIKVKELTIWHILLSKAYFAGPEPGILLAPKMENRDELLEILRQKAIGFAVKTAA